MIHSAPWCDVLDIESPGGTPISGDIRGEISILHRHSSAVTGISLFGIGGRVDLGQAANALPGHQARLI
jgi:hypothetical protein